MDHYMDVKILSDPEFSKPILMNALFAKFHRALVNLKCNCIGISFPDHQIDIPCLGALFRIHGEIGGLKKLTAMNWVVGMRDHVEINQIEPVPKHTRYCRVRRVQAKSSVNRLRRRYMSRHDVTEKECIRRLPDSVEQHLKLPYIRVKSSSTEHAFCLFIEHLEPQDEPVSGMFNSYGLGKKATVPWF